MNRTALAAMIAAVAGTAVAQPVQWRVEDGGNGHWYEGVRVAAGVDWAEARTAAQQAGSQLACCESLDERRFIIDRFGLQQRPDLYVAQVSYSEYPRFGPWLGGYQLAGSRETTTGWRWISGESFDPSDAYCCNNSACDGSSESVLHLYAHISPSGVIMSWNDMPPIRMACMSPVPSYLVEWSADCNNDGLVDKGQILAGELSDTNNNGIPDGPGIAVQPTDQSVSVGNAATFIVQVAAAPACTTPVTYQWQRRNPAVADPAALGAWIDLADDATFSGVQARNLSITNPIPALATGYRCKIGGGCGCEPNPGGFIYTDTVNFNIACPADFNADGGVDFTDVEAFFERWENGC